MGSVWSSENQNGLQCGDDAGNVPTCSASEAASEEYRGSKSPSSPGELIQLGRLALEVGKNMQALGLLEQAWERAKWEQSAVDRGLACRALADFHQQTGNPVLAFQFTQLAVSAELESTVEDCSGVDDSSSAGQRLFLLEQGRQRFLQGNWTAGFESWEQAGKLSELEGDVQGSQQFQRLSSKVRAWIDRLSCDPSRN